MSPLNLSAWRLENSVRTDMHPGEKWNRAYAIDPTPLLVDRITKIHHAGFETRYQPAMEEIMVRLAVNTDVAERLGHELEAAAGQKIKTDLIGDDPTFLLPLSLYEEKFGGVIPGAGQRKDAIEVFVRAFPAGVPGSVTVQAKPGFIKALHAALESSGRDFIVAHPEGKGGHQRQCLLTTEVDLQAVLAEYPTLREQFERDSVRPHQERSGPSSYR